MTVPPSTPFPSCVMAPVPEKGTVSGKLLSTPRRRSTWSLRIPKGDPLGGRTSTRTTERFAAGGRHSPRKQTFDLEHWLLLEQEEAVTRGSRKEHAASIAASVTA